MDTEMEFEAYSNLTDIQKFFYGQSVLLTGATGLLGKIVLEKLLRSCPGIGTIYILVRPKRGLTPEQRLDKLFKLELFKVVREVFPAFRKKVQLIEGDISKDALGTAFEDYEKLCQNVSIVLHAAASVVFTETLKTSVNNNLKSTRQILKLCHELRTLKAFVHVSTLYVQREEDNSVLEKIPKCKVDPEKLMDTLEWLDDNSAEALSNYLTENKRFTTYLITKALAEVYIDQHRGDLPVAIVRPPYIGPTNHEPFPGWIDTIQGISGLLLAGAKGVLRTLMTIKGVRVQISPVDFISNTIIVSAWQVGITRPANVLIVNAAMDFYALPEAEKFLPGVLEKRSQYPLVNMFRYPDFTVYYNIYFYYIHSFFDEWIPAVICDFFLFIFTGKTILVRVHKKIQFLYSIFLKLGIEPWIHRTDNIRMLKNSLSEEDDKNFFIPLDDFNWENYLEHCFTGGRRFLAKEDPSNIPYAKKKAFIWWAVTTTIKWILILYFIYYLFTSSFFTPLYKNIEETIYAVQ